MCCMQLLLLLALLHVDTRVCQTISASPHEKRLQDLNETMLGAATWHLSGLRQLQMPAPPARPLALQTAGAGGAAIGPARRALKTVSPPLPPPGGAYYSSGLSSTCAAYSASVNFNAIRANMPGFPVAAGNTPMLCYSLCRDGNLITTWKRHAGPQAPARIQLL